MKQAAALKDKAARDNAEEKCKKEYVQCLERFVYPLERIARRVRKDPSIKKRVADAKKETDDCTERANKITNEKERNAELEKCANLFAARLRELDLFSALTSSNLWDDVFRVLGPKEKKDCPCCVVGDVQMNDKAGGSLQCVKSLSEYVAKGRKWPNQFGDPKYLEKTGLVGSNRLAAGYTVEISAKWEDSKKCPCDCEWTQFVNVLGTDEGWREDRAPTGDPASATAAELRSQWIKCCKPPNDRLFMGDNVVQELQQDERLSGKTIYFRTVFFSSGTNCRLKYVALDWKLEVYWNHPEDETHADGKVEAKATVLGTSEG